MEFLKRVWARYPNHAKELISVVLTSILHMAIPKKKESNGKMWKGRGKKYEYGEEKEEGQQWNTKEMQDGRGARGKNEGRGKERKVMGKKGNFRTMNGKKACTIKYYQHKPGLC